MSERLDIYFSRFGRTVEYTPSGGSAREITAIFDANYVPSYVIGIEHQNAGPRVLCKSEDVEEDVSQGATFLIDTVTYSVIEVRPDGTGIHELILSRN